MTSTLYTERQKQEIYYALYVCVWILAYVTKSTIRSYERYLPNHCTNTMIIKQHWVFLRFFFQFDTFIILQKKCIKESEEKNGWYKSPSRQNNTKKNYDENIEQNMQSKSLRLVGSITRQTMNIIYSLNDMISVILFGNIFFPDFWNNHKHKQNGAVQHWIIC